MNCSPVLGVPDGQIMWYEVKGRFVQQPVASCVCAWLGQKHYLQQYISFSVLAILELCRLSCLYSLIPTWSNTICHSQMQLYHYLCLPFVPTSVELGNVQYFICVWKVDLIEQEDLDSSGVCLFYCEEDIVLFMKYAVLWYFFYGRHFTFLWNIKVCFFFPSTRQCYDLEVCVFMNWVLLLLMINVVCYLWNIKL